MRYADDFVVLVHGTKSEAETLKRLLAHVVFGPVVADEQHQDPPLRSRPIMMRSPRKARLAL
ncbi:MULTISPECIES: hypothetical protein [unclassified Streptomyces]|uniref:hypothetical protein n=1 Tax=unclassified Streptomyces TaxID=2593676 RepID=UPI0033A55642